MRLRRRSAAQAFVEFALAAPFVLLLVVGAGQLGAVAYGMVSTDTAAREGARYGAEHPLTSLTSSGFVVDPQTGLPTYQCNYAADNETVPSGNPICQAVYRAHGLLDPQQFIITIRTNVPIFPSSLVPTDVVRVGNNTPSPTPLPCGSDAEVDGSIQFSDGSSNTLGVQVSATGQGTFPTANIPANATTYRLCLAVKTTQTINAVMGPSGCGGYKGQATVKVQNNSNPYNPTPDPLVLTPNPCPTPTPTPTATASPTPTTSSTPAPTDTPPAAFSCDNSAASTTQYFQVTVQYPVPIFVPLIGTMVGDPGNAAQRTVKATVTQRIEPCTITGNQ